MKTIKVSEATDVRSDRFVLSQQRYFRGLLGHRGHGKDVITGAYRTYTDECMLRGLLYTPPPYYQYTLTEKGLALDENNQSI